MINGLFEAAMLICFAVSWPFNIRASYLARTAVNKSAMFEVIVLVGYFFGVTNKFVTNDITYVLWFYILDICLVSTDLLLYVRNLRLDRARTA